MTEDPRGRGYPALSKPSARVTQAYRGFWWSLLVERRRSLVRVQQVRRSLRALHARRR